VTKTDEQMEKNERGFCRDIADPAVLRDVLLVVIGASVESVVMNLLAMRLIDQH